MKSKKSASSLTTRSTESKMKPSQKENDFTAKVVLILQLCKLSHQSQNIRVCHSITLTLMLDHLREYIGSIIVSIPSLLTESFHITGKLRPSAFPIVREDDEVVHLIGVIEYLDLLVVLLSIGHELGCVVAVLAAYSLHVVHKYTASVVSLNHTSACLLLTQHLSHSLLGVLDWLLRVEYIGNIHAIHMLIIAYTT